jgi:hypothetical protein
VHLQTGRIEGIVAYADGRPAGGCRVIADGEGAADGARIQAISDAAGRYSLRVPAGEYRVRADRERLEEARSGGLAVTASGVTDAGTLALAPLGRFAGRVLFEGPPPPLVAIVLRGEGGNVLWQRVGEGGTFDVRGVEPGSYALELTGPGYDRATVPDRIAIERTPLVDQVVRPAAR